MKHFKLLSQAAIFCTMFCLHTSAATESLKATWFEGTNHATIRTTEAGRLRTYELSTTAELRDNQPANKRVEIKEVAGHATVRSGDVLFDGLYALAVQEAIQNSVNQIKDYAYNHDQPIKLKAFQTGIVWTYVWTRDSAYSCRLALGGFDPERAMSSLLFKTSGLKPSVSGGFQHQIIQDTGSGGSYPISSDRIVWILGASEALKFLPEPRQKEFLSQVYQILHDTLEEDRRLIFDPADGLYRGEQSFLDWREQTYPMWTKDNVMAIGMSKALSVNAADYFALLTASKYAGKLGYHDDEARYTSWAKALKKAINKNFYDSKTGLYSTYLLTDTIKGVRVKRYDLLGESLAILCGVASHSQAQSILKHYPVGPYGPPVVWPESTAVPIYHNQAIWPFVTAFWTEAGRKVGDAAVINHGVHSLMRGAVFNLSNMENYDFVTGKPQVKNGTLSGPVVNSRRQLWSIAGYLAMVQEVVFGLETSWEGIRFLPCISGDLRNNVFGSSTVIELQDFPYRGKRISVRVHLPPAGFSGNGLCTIRKIELNGKPIGRSFIASSVLASDNKWDIYLKKPADDSSAGDLNIVTDQIHQHAIYGPTQPEWVDFGQGGIAMENGKLMLRYRQAGSSIVVFNIYRDGKLCAKHVKETHWLDPHSADYRDKTHFYAIEAVDPKTGNASHLTHSHYYGGPFNHWEIPAADMKNHGGELAEGRYFKDWGKPRDELSANFTASRSGQYLVRVKFSNGTGPANTGIACGVKKIEVRNANSRRLVSDGYLIMPQSGDWQRFDLSSIVRAKLKEGQTYLICIFEDPYSRNMSYLKRNEDYTANVGGGEGPYNFVNVSAIELLRTGK